jgi:hypothetical protein
MTTKVMTKTTAARLIDEKLTRQAAVAAPKAKMRSARTAGVIRSEVIAFSAKADSSQVT